MIFELIINVITIFIGNSCNKKINILGNYYLKCKYMRYKYIWVISFFYMLIFITIIIIMKYNELSRDKHPK